MNQTHVQLLTEVRQRVEELAAVINQGEGRRQEFDRSFQELRDTVQATNDHLTQQDSRSALAQASIEALRVELSSHLTDHKSLLRARRLTSWSAASVAIAALGYLVVALVTHSKLEAVGASRDTTIAHIAVAALTSCYYAEEADTLVKLSTARDADTRVKLSTAQGTRVVRLRELPSCAVLDAGIRARLDGLLNIGRRGP